MAETDATGWPLGLTDNTKQFITSSLAALLAHRKHVTTQDAMDHLRRANVPQLREYNDAVVLSWKRAVVERALRAAGAQPTWVGPAGW